MRRYHTTEVPAGILKEGMKLILEIGRVQYKGYAKMVLTGGGTWLGVYYTATRMGVDEPWWTGDTKRDEGPYTLGTFNYVIIPSRKVGKFIP